MNTVGTLLATSTRSLRKNRMRTLLTALGIIIGVLAVVVLVSLGKSFEADVNEQIGALGANLLTITPARAETAGGVAQSTTQPTLTAADAQALRAVPDLAAVSEVVVVPQQLVAEGRNWSSTVNGVAPAFFAVRSYELAAGRALTDADVRARAKVVVIGQTVADELFADANPIGAPLRVGLIPCTVVGVLAAKGSGGMGDDDDVVLAPWTTVLYRLTGERTLSYIAASATAPEAMARAEARVRTTLRIQHGLGGTTTDDFEIFNQTDLLTQVGEILGALTLFLGSIAGVSLLVGGIGIMNIMLVSVTERTREIGIRLAVGARARDVLRQFLVEAVLLSLFGGAIGLALGVALTALVAHLTDLPFVLETRVLLLAAGFSCAVGVFFGYYPARKAAALDPIQALRYE